MAFDRKTLYSKLFEPVPFTKEEEEHALNIDVSPVGDEALSKEEVDRVLSNIGYDESPDGFEIDLGDDDDNAGDDETEEDKAQTSEPELANAVDARKQRSEQLVQQIRHETEYSPEALEEEYRIKPSGGGGGPPPPPPPPPSPDSPYDDEGPRSYTGPREAPEANIVTVRRPIFTAYHEQRIPERIRNVRIYEEEPEQEQERHEPSNDWERHMFLGNLQDALHKTTGQGFRFLGNVAGGVARAVGNMAPVLDYGGSPVWGKSPDAGAFLKGLGEAGGVFGEQLGELAGKIAEQNVTGQIQDEKARQGAIEHLQESLRQKMLEHARQLADEGFFPEDENGNFIIPASFWNYLRVYANAQAVEAQAYARNKGQYGRV